MRKTWAFSNLSHRVLNFNIPLKSLTSLPIQDTPRPVLSSCNTHSISKGKPAVNPKMENPPPLCKGSAPTEDASTEGPEAELCPAEKICVTSEALGSPKALSDWLVARLAQGSEIVSQWGKLQGTKRISNLWKELVDGEISLEDSVPPKRTVHVVRVKIIDNNGNMLLESHQEMGDGSIRHRNRPLSEKMKPGESVESACLRGIQEELGSTLGSPGRVQIRRDTYRREEEERESFTYPGLMTRYVLHSMEAVMEHLPTDDFVTEENEYNDDGGQISGSLDGENALVGVRRHAWTWVPAS